MKKGIVIAMKEEFQKVLGERKIAKISETPFPVYSVESGVCEIVAAVCGIGKVNAAAGTAYLIDAYKVDEIVNFGVCGATKAAFLRGETAVIGTVVERDFDLSAGLGPEWKSPRVTLATGDPEAVLYTADVFTTTSEYDGYFDMEGYAVARVAEIYGKKCTLIKSVTDIIDSGVQTEQFICNYDRACSLLHDALAGHI